METNYLFIDDSGSKEWDTPYSRTFVDTPPVRNEQNLNFWRKNYFVLAGLHISNTTLAKLNPQINNLKQEYFNTKYVEIKSEWLRIPEKRKRKYLEPFGITEEKLKEFTEKWYAIFSQNPNAIQVHSFVLDKRYYKNKRERCTPLQILTQVLFDRVELHKSRECNIIFDQMECEIKTEKRNHGHILKISNKEIDLGSFHKKYSHAQPTFEKSINSNFLQLADTAAYNVLRQFIEYGDLWEGAGNERLKIYAYLAKILPNFYTFNKRIAGFGIVKVPDTSKVRWSLE